LLEKYGPDSREYQKALRKKNKTMEKLWDPRIKIPKLIRYNALKVSKAILLYYFLYYYVKDPNCVILSQPSQLCFLLKTEKKQKKRRKTGKNLGFCF
jgi:hypothetical protein